MLTEKQIEQNRRAIEGAREGSYTRRLLQKVVWYISLRSPNPDGTNWAMAKQRLERFASELDLILPEGLVSLVDDCERVRGMGIEDALDAYAEIVVYSFDEPNIPCAEVVYARNNN